MILLERFAHTRCGTLGRLTAGGLSLYTVELPWQGNERNESCIPPGVYRFQKHESPRHGNTLWLRDVPERSEILVHIANSPADLDGCIAPGRDYGWWPERKELGVMRSADAATALFAAVQDEGDIDIRTWRPEYP